MRKCTICTHKQRSAIDSALTGNESFRHIAAQFGTSTTALQRHKADHIPKELIRAKEATEIARAGTLLGQVRRLCARFDNLLTESETIVANEKKSGRTSGVLNALKTAAIVGRELSRQLALLGEVSGELNRAATVNISAPEGRFIVLPSVPDPPDLQRAIGPPTGVPNVTQTRGCP